MIVRQPSLCCIVGTCPFYKTVFNLTLLYGRQFVPVAYAGIEKEVFPELLTLGMTHTKLLALVGYLWCTISTFVLKYSVAFRFIILNMWPSFNCSTRYSTCSKPTVLNV